MEKNERVDVESSSEVKTDDGVSEDRALAVAWKELADRSRPTGFVYVPAALGLTCLTPGLASKPLLVLGCILYFSLITLWRAWSARNLQHKALNLDRTAKLHFDWSGRIAALSIGLLAAATVHVSSGTQIWLAFLVVSALVAGAMSSLAPDFVLYAQYWALLTFPVEIALILSEDNKYLLVSLLVFTLTILALFATWHNHRAYWRFLTNNRRQVEELDAARERLQMVIHGSNLGAFDWSLSWGQIVFDEKLAEILDYPPETYAPYEGKLEGLVYKEDVSSVREALIKGLKNPNSPLIEVEARFETSQNEIRWFLFRCRVVTRDSAGRALRITGTYEHISSQKLAEIEMSQLKEQMEQAERLKTLGVLAGGVAHDFNNLLLAILGNLEIAQDGIEEGGDAHQCLQHAVRAAQDASELSDQLLAYSGKGQFKIETFCLNQLVSNLSHLLKVTVGKRSQLVTKLEPELPLISGDIGQMRQVILNLLTNAADAVEGRNGLIVVSTYKVDMGSEEASARQVAVGEYIRLSVEDDGCGMEASTVKRIFDPFFTTKFTGRGLGLASTIGIVKNHKGAIDVHSEPGKGTKFSLLLPAAEKQCATLKVEYPVAGCSRPKEILVVDDESSIRTLARRILSGAGHSVSLAENGEVALEKLQQDHRKIDLVLLDLTMPRKDGYQTLKEIRRRWPKLSVILSSGYSEDEVLQKAQSKVQGFLKKPFTRDCLLNQIERI